MPDHHRPAVGAGTATGNQIGGGVSEEASEFSDADVISRHFKLDQRIVAAYDHACAFQRLAHEKWARGGWCACEGDEIVAGQSPTPRRDFSLFHASSHR